MQWYLALSVNARAINLPGFAWALTENEKNCKDAALLIENFVKEHGGKIEFADVARLNWRDWLKNKISQEINAYKEKSQSIKALLNDLISLVKTKNTITRETSGYEI